MKTVCLWGGGRLASIRAYCNHPITAMSAMPHISMKNEEDNSSSSSSCSSMATALPKLEYSQEADHLASLLLHHHNPLQPKKASLQLDRYSITLPLLHQTLLRLRDTSKIAFSFFTHATSSHLLRPDAAAYAILVDSLGKVRQFDLVWQLLMEMNQQHGLNPNASVFSVLIRRLVAAGYTRKAIRAFEDMESLTEKEPTLHDFSFLIDTLCKYNHVNVATEVFNRKKSVFTPDVKLYTLLVYGWCKVRKLAMAKRFFREMEGRGIQPNIVTYNVLLNGICRRASLHPDYRFFGTLKAAENLLEEMSGKGFEPDITSHSIVLHLYSRAHKPELMLKKLEEMKGKGVFPTVATYTSVIKCLCSCARIREAEVILSEMEENGVGPCSETYNCFLKEYRGRGDATSALKMYRKMKESSSTSKDTRRIKGCNIMLAMFMSLDIPEVVEEILEDMKDGGLGPDLDSYTSLVHRMCWRGRWRAACEVFMEMIEKGFLPQKRTFETLYRGLIRAGMVRMLTRLKKRLREESLTFSSEFDKYHIKPYIYSRR